MTKSHLGRHCLILSIMAVAWQAQAQTPPSPLGPAPTDAPALNPLEGVPTAQSNDAALEQLLDLINPIVTTSTKDNRRAESAPSIIMVLTRQDMRNWGYDTLSEALNHILGFYVVDDHVLPNVAARGISAGFRGESSVIKVLMNGSPVSFRSTNGNWLGAQLIPLTAVERIEIIRGPASALYGADAFLGVVNIITRQPTKDMADVWASGNWRQGNSSVGYDQDICGNIRRERWEAFASLRLEAEDRSGLVLPPNPPAPNLPSYAPDRTTSTGDLMPSRTGLVRAQYHFSKHTHLSASGYFSYLERIDEFAGLVQLANGVDPQGRVSQNNTSLLQGFANLQFTSKLTDNVDLTALATYFFGRPRTFNRTEVNSDFYYVRRNAGFSGIDASVEARWSVLPNLSFTGGLELIYDDEQLPSNLGIAKLSVIGTTPGEVIPGFSSTQGSKAIYNPAAYLQGLWTVDKRYLTVLAGFRYDYHTIYLGQPSARLGLVSEPLEKLYVKLLYGSAFKAPSPLLLYGLPATSGDITGNTALLPQRVNTFELEITRTFFDFISASTGLAYSLLDNQAEFTQTGAYQLAVNLASVHSLSWETRLRMVRPNNFEAYANFELNVTQRFSTDIGYKQQLNGDRNYTYPPVQLHAGVIKWMPRWHLRGMLDVTYVSPRNSTGSNTLDNGAPYELPQYVDIGVGLATLGFKLLENKPLTLGVVARNLLNENAGDTGYLGVDYPRLPRSIFFYVNQEF